MNPEQTAGTFLALCGLVIWLPSVVARALTKADQRFEQLADDAEEFARQRQASLNAHPSARRIRLLMAENEARREAEHIDSEWEAMNR